jgi:murein DD-endopeptidase MepM/ murein hydrolase activator NlpD
MEVDGHSGHTWKTQGHGSPSRPKSRPDRQGGRRDGEECATLVGVAGPDLGGPETTAGLERILARSTGAGSIRAAFLRIAGPFPVAGPARWANDWHVRRCEPYPHLHEGLDIFAEAGTPVVAVADGRVSQSANDAIAGLSVEIVDGDGVQYFYAHLSRIAAGVSVGDPVETGDVLGYVGATGNAMGGPPHLHLEVQPGGVPVPPKPYVDRWLAISIRRAPSMIRSASRPAFPGPLVPREEPSVAVPSFRVLFDGWPTPARGRTWHPLIQPMAVAALGVGVLVVLGLSWRSGTRQRLAWRQLAHAVRMSTARSASR